MQFKLQGRIGAKGFSRILNAVDEIEGERVLEGCALMLSLCTEESWWVELLRDGQVIAMEYLDPSSSQES